MGLFGFDHLAGIGKTTVTARGAVFDRRKRRKYGMDAEVTGEPDDDHRAPGRAEVRDHSARGPDPLGPDFGVASLRFRETAVYRRYLGVFSIPAKASYR